LELGVGGGVGETTTSCDRQLLDRRRAAPVSPPALPLLALADTARPGQMPSSITIQGAGRALQRATKGMAKPQDGPGQLTAALESRKQLAATLTAAEPDGAQVLSIGSAPRYITDRQERITTWEQRLGAAAGASMRPPIPDSGNSKGPCGGDSARTHHTRGLRVANRPAAPGEGTRPG
jgi:hypothetical protein